VQAERLQLQRNRRRDPLDALVGRRDDDEAVASSRDDLLACVGPAAALDEPGVGRDLVGAVDGDVQPVALAEALERRPSARAATSVCSDVAMQVMSSRRAARAGRKCATVVPVPSPTAMPSSTSSAAASAARRFWSSFPTRIR
jgi:hypothetical protein